MSRKEGWIEATARTGWPAGLLSDDSRAIWNWFFNRIDGRTLLRESIEKAEKERIERESCKDQPPLR